MHHRKALLSPCKGLMMTSAKVPCVLPQPRNLPQRACNCWAAGMGKKAGWASRSACTFRPRSSCTQGNASHVPHAVAPATPLRAPHACHSHNRDDGVHQLRFPYAIAQQHRCTNANAESPPVCMQGAMQAHASEGKGMEGDVEACMYSCIRNARSMRMLSVSVSEFQSVGGCQTPTNPGPVRCAAPRSPSHNKAHQSTR